MAVHKEKALFLVLGFLALPMLSGCNEADLESDKVTIVRDDVIRKTFIESVEKRMKDSPGLVPNKTLIKQLSRTECVIDDLPPVGTQTLSPQEIYQQAVESTVVMSTVFHCPNKACKKLHTASSSAVIIHEDGIVATNYHVVDSHVDDGLGMAIMTYDGRVFLVDEVLAASKEQDVALVKVRNPSGLTAAPIFRDEPVGAPITVISHPNNKFYMLTHGYVSRYAAMGKKIVMNITADYARGSSGGPFFNSRGDLVGLVSSTSSLVAKQQLLTVGDDNKLFFGHLPKPAKTKAPAKKKPVEKVSEATGSDANVSATKKPVKKPSPKKKEPAKKPQHKKRKTVILTNSHQMTVKNGVPSREILNLIKSPSRQE